MFILSDKSLDQTQAAVAYENFLLLGLSHGIRTESCRCLRHTRTGPWAALQQNWGGESFHLTLIKQLDLESLLGMFEDREVLTGATHLRKECNMPAQAA